MKEGINKMKQTDKMQNFFMQNATSYMPTHPAQGLSIYTSKIKTKTKTDRGHK